MSKRANKPKEDRDFAALKKCAGALARCTSRRMVRATLEFLCDRFIHHPSAALPKHLQ